MVSKLGFKTSGDGIWIMKSVGQAGRGCGSASRGPGLGSGWIGCQDCDQCGRVRGTYSLLWHCGFHSEAILCSLLYGKIHRPFGLDGWLVVVLTVAPAFNCAHPNCPTTSVCSASRAPKKGRTFSAACERPQIFSDPFHGHCFSQQLFTVKMSLDFAKVDI